MLKAMGDSTRRMLLTQLCQHGPARVTELAHYYDMSLNAISKHIKVLEKAELVNRNTVGRDHWIEADLNKIGLVDDWFKTLKSIWMIRLDKLDELLQKGDDEDE